MARSDFKTIEEYSSNLPNDVRERIETIRKLIKENVPPESEETISYQIPCFKLNGKFIIYFAGYKNHTSIYPIPPGPKDFEKEIEPFIKGKGTLQFPNDKELPTKVIKEVIKYSVASNAKRTKTY